MKAILLLAILTLGSCSTRVIDDEVPKPNEVAPATMTTLCLSVAVPQTLRDTRGPLPEEDGTGAESTITELTVICYNDADRKVHYHDYGTIAGAIPEIQVPVSTKKIYVIANATDLIKFKIVPLIDFADFNSMTLADRDEVNKMSTAKKFMMTNTTGLVDVQDDGDGTLSARVTVERVVSKVQLIANTPTLNMPATGADAVVTAVKINKFWLNTTNRFFYPTSSFVTYGHPTATDTPVADSYRQDPNYTRSIDLIQQPNGGAGAGATGAFNWINQLHENVAASYPDVKSAVFGKELYSLENTMDIAGQNYNNITKLTIQAQFKMGDTEYIHLLRYNGMYYHVFPFKKDIYGKAGVDLRAKFDLFVKTALNNPNATWASITNLIHLNDPQIIKRLSDNADKDFGGLEFFQFGTCYYEVYLKHDNRVAKKNVGRWGMVRNNWYKFTITGINGIGLPFIPDPTDSNNKNPLNPDPDNPVFPDADSAIIDVDITIAPWTYRDMDHNFGDGVVGA